MKMATALRFSIRHHRLSSTTAAAATIDTVSRDRRIRRFANTRQFSDIEKLIESQKNDHTKITNEDYLSSLIRSYGVGHMSDKALGLFNQMEELGTPRSSISFNALLSSYNMCRKFDKVPKLFDEIPKKYGFQPDTVSYGILIKSYCQSSLPESAYPVLEEMGKNNVEISTGIYSMILEALYKKGKVDEAEKIWKEMIEKECLPDVAAYNVLIAQARKGKPEDVLAVIDEMRNAGLKPDTTSYNYLFTCYCVNGMWEDAQKVYQDLEENGCAPNSATYRLHIFNLCKNGDFEKAYEVFKESMKRDRIPSFNTLKRLVEGLVENSSREEAKELIATVKEKFADNIFNGWSKLEVELGLTKDEESPKEEVAASA